MCPGLGAEGPLDLQIFFSIDLEAQKGFLSPDSNLYRTSSERSRGENFQIQQFQQNFRLEGCLTVHFPHEII